jgi:hypothetical protein
MKIKYRIRRELIRLFIALIGNKLRKTFCFSGLALLGLVFLGGGQSEAQEVTSTFSFHVNFTSRLGLHNSNPTSDKPQSKLWFMDSHWWALLNSSSGPTLWQRTDNGWKEHREVSNSLKGIPGQADVWYENRTATAVTVSDSSLYIIRLKPEDSSDAHWHAKVLDRLNIPQKKPKIETATIAKDADGNWWVAADIRKAIYVWDSKDATHWGNAMLMGRHISADDISSIAALKHSVIVIWSNQTRDYSVDSREHINGHPIDDWSAIDTIASGNQTADDHINTALSANGTLWVTTKNSADKVNYPQLVLRVRTADGSWRNYPYFKRGQYLIPSRPIINTTPDRNLILSCYTIYDHTNRHKDRIGCGMIDTSSARILKKRSIIIAPDSSRKVQVNNVTGPKATFPPHAPWIVLASDNKGNVYEADLRSFFGKNVDH